MSNEAEQGAPGQGSREARQHFAERFAHQWSQARAERRPEPLPIMGGTTNLAKAQVPYGVDLAAAWRLASSMRNAGVLFRAKSLEAVPTDSRDADGIARILGLPGGSGYELAERYRRVARRARAAHEAELYGA